MSNRVLAKLASLRKESPHWLPEHHLTHALAPYVSQLTPSELAQLAPSFFASPPVVFYLELRHLSATRLRELRALWPTRASGWLCFLYVATAHATTDTELIQAWSGGLKVLHSFDNDEGKRAERALARFANDASLLPAFRSWMEQEQNPTVARVLATAADDLSVQALQPFLMRSLAGDDQALTQAFAMRKQLCRSPSLRAQEKQIQAAIVARAQRTELPQWLAAVGVEIPVEDTSVSVLAKAACCDDSLRIYGLNFRLTLTGCSENWAHATVENENFDPLVVWTNGITVKNLIPEEHGPTTLLELPAYLATLKTRLEATWERILVTAPALDAKSIQRINEWLG